VTVRAHSHVTFHFGRVVDCSRWAAQYHVARRAVVLWVGDLVSAGLTLLSTGAAYGVIVAVFHWGWLGGGIDNGTTAPVDPWIPLMLFAPPPHHGPTRQGRTHQDAPQALHFPGQRTTRAQAPAPPGRASSRAHGPPSCRPAALAGVLWPAG